MSNIFSRSPYIITIDEAGQVQTTLKLYLWRGYGTAPTEPQYTFTKVIPSSNKPATYYDISPYINEYFDLLLTEDITSPSLSDVTMWLNVKVERIADTVNLGSTTYKAFYGYTEFTNGYNYDNGSLLIDQSTFYFYSDATNKGCFYYLTPTIGVEGTLIVVYTDLVTGSQYTYELTDSNKLYMIPSVHYSNGNKIEIIHIVGETSTTLKTLYFKPKDECKYTPVKCDFINKYGGWQRIWFYKASNETFNVESNEYNLLPFYYPNYSTSMAQRQSFNSNAKETIKVNTDWVDEDYKEVIKQLMLSEKIRIDDKPAIIKTKSLELFKSINTKMINYQLEFDIATNYINNVF